MVFASRRLLPLFVVVLTLSLSVSSFAQRRRPTGPSVGGNGGNTSAQLTVQVTRENSRNLDMQVSVELLSSGSRQMNNSTFTDSNGRAILNVPGPGTYQIRITGPYIEDTTAAGIWIQPGEMMHHEYVAVKMKPNPNAVSAPGGEATISADQLSVPEKARKEYAKGLEEMHKKNWKSAREHFDKATRHYDKFDWAYNALGVVCMASGDKAAAHDAFSKAVEINSRNAGAERNLARLMIGEGDFLHAEDHARHSLIAEPQNPDALTLEGFAQLKQGKFDAALDSARQVHSAAKHLFPFSHLIAARALEAKQLKDQAAAEYRTYLSESPDAPEATLAREGLQRVGPK